MSSLRLRRHLPDREPRLGHARRSRGRLAGRTHPSRGQRPLDVGPQPNYIGTDPDVIADQLIERYAEPLPDLYAGPLPDLVVGHDDVLRRGPVDARP
jgi:hypothetical protein